MGSGKDEKREDDEKPIVDPDEKIPYPKSVFFILSTEACERFSYYGMRAILSLYLKHLFVTNSGWSNDEAEDTSTILYHAFVFLSYFTSIFGAWLADSFLGKFKTIFYISIVYAIGQCILAFGAVPSGEQFFGIHGLPQQAISFIGLALIGFGTGGIKPCVVSFGADQFVLPNQKGEMDTFFGIFYASINFGSMISTILTPIFRRQDCFGDECYTLAFGVPAALMVIAIVFFVMGRPGYTVKIPERNVVADFFGCIWAAIKNRREPADHWLDRAEPIYGQQFCDDVKAVLRVGVLFLLYPIFWALYDQQGSRWTFQATRMNGRVGSVDILPDQMQVINAVLILVFIPIFDKGIYPLCNKLRLMRTPLQRIITGGVLLAVAFVVSGIVELFLQKSYPHPPGATSARVSFHNGLPVSLGCEMNVEVFLPEGFDKPEKLEHIFNGTSAAITDSKGHELVHKFEKNVTITAQATITFECSKDRKIMDITKQDITIRPDYAHTFYVHQPDPEQDKAEIYEPDFTDEIDKSGTGFPYMRFIYKLPDGFLDTFPNKQVMLTFSKKKYTPGSGKEGGLGGSVILNSTESIADIAGIESDKQGDFKICLEEVPVEPEVPEGETDRDDEGEGEEEKLWSVCAIQEVQEFAEEGDEEVADYNEYRYGGSYNLYLVLAGASAAADNPAKQKLFVTIDEVTEHNTVHMLWLMPQYVILTAGEVLFSITSLAFAFTQAPESMKSVVQALYLLTTAFGNLIDLVVVAVLSGVFSSQAYEFFLFAGLMVLDMAALAFLAMRYEYVDEYAQMPSSGSRKSSLASKS